MTIPYLRPSHRTQYESMTWIKENNCCGHIKIKLVWFCGLGWYFTSELLLWKKPKSKNFKIVMDYSKDKRLWTTGKELPQCAAAAIEDAKEMCRKHGVKHLRKFKPFKIRPPLK